MFIAVPFLIGAVLGLCAAYFLSDLALVALFLIAVVWFLRVLFPGEKGGGEGLMGVALFGAPLVIGFFVGAAAMWVYVSWPPLDPGGSATIWETISHYLFRR